jgi:hypothetical protein
MNTSINQNIATIIGSGATTFSDFVVKSRLAEVAVEKAFRHMHDPVSRITFGARLQDNPRVRFTFVDEHGKMRVIHSPVLCEDTSGDEPIPVVVALLGDAILEKTYIVLSADVFSKVALVLISDRNATALGMTKLPTGVTELVDDEDVDVVITDVFNGTAYPDGPVIVPMTLMNPLPVGYNAYHGHPIADLIPAATAASDKWKFTDAIHAVLSHAHTTARGASLHNHEVHSSFGESNWTIGGNGVDCIAACGEHLAETIYVPFEILDPTLPLADEARALIHEHLAMAMACEADAIAGFTRVIPVPPGGSTTPAGTAELLKGMTDTLGVVFSNSKEGTLAAERKTQSDLNGKKWACWTASKEMGSTGQFIARPGTLNPKFTKILGCRDATVATNLMKQLFRETLNKLEINNKRVGILCDFQIDSITPAYMKCLQNCLWMEEPLQYSKDILDRRLSILQFLSIDQRNIAFRLMRSSDRTKMMNDLHEDNDDKKSPKTKFLFIDGEMYDSPHLAKCLCNFFVHMHCWVENPTETMVYQQLHMRLMLFQSQGGKLWLEHTKMSHKHIFHSLMMDIQSVIHAVSSTMIGNTTWIDHVDDGNEILSKDSLDLVEHCSRFGMQALHTAIAGNNGPFDTPPITFSWFECPQIRQRGLWLGNVPPKHHRLDNQIFGTPQGDHRPSGLAPGGNRITPERDNRRDQGRVQPRDPRNGPVMDLATIDRFKGMGFLKTTQPRMQNFSHIFNSFGKKVLCKGFCYINHFCPTKSGTCKYAHITGLSKMDETDQKATIAWVKSEKAVSFVDGRGPKSTGS